MFFGQILYRFTRNFNIVSISYDKSNATKCNVNCMRHKLKTKWPDGTTKTCCQHDIIVQKLEKINIFKTQHIKSANRRRHLPQLKALFKTCKFVLNPSLDTTCIKFSHRLFHLVPQKVTNSSTAVDLIFFLTYEIRAVQWEDNTRYHSYARSCFLIDS